MSAYVERTKNGRGRQTVARPGKTEIIWSNISSLVGNIFEMDRKIKKNGNNN